MLAPLASQEVAAVPPAVSRTGRTTSEGVQFLLGHHVYFQLAQRGHPHDRRNRLTLILLLCGHTSRPHAGTEEADRTRTEARTLPGPPPRSTTRCHRPWEGG